MDNALYGVGSAAQFGRGCSRRLPKRILSLLDFYGPKEQSCQVWCKSELFCILIHFLLAPKELFETVVFSLNDCILEYFYYVQKTLFHYDKPTC